MKNSSFFSKEQEEFVVNNSLNCVKLDDYCGKLYPKGFFNVFFLIALLVKTDQTSLNS